MFHCTAELKQYSPVNVKGRCRLALLITLNIHMIFKHIHKITTKRKHHKLPTHSFFIDRRWPLRPIYCMSAYWYVSIANACFWLKPARWGILLVEEELSHLWPTASNPANELNSQRFDIYALHSYSQVVNGETRSNSSMTLDKVWQNGINCVKIYFFLRCWTPGHFKLYVPLYLHCHNCEFVLRTMTEPKCPVYLLRSVYVCKFYILFYSVRSEGKQDHEYSGC